ncbi:MAG: Gfo/Idh/MocA family oxidoreductase [Pirellulaceae bacterium]|nr:Gfo/Idh/MocA family oxidoreductase [Pirellulaceae bacterium]
MAQFSRRQFLQDTLIATAAAATAGPALLSHAAEAETPAVGPNEKLGIAMVGVNGQGNNHIKEYLKRRDVEIVCVCDVDEKVGRNRVEEIAKRQKRKPRYVKDVREVCDDQSVDFVSIATPNFWHSLGAIWAIQAGKDVYVEKPVSHNVSEGRRIVEAARKHGRICQMGAQCRSMKGTIDAIDYVKSGKIGEVKLARGLCYKPRRPIGPPGVFDPPAEVDYDLYLGPCAIAPVTRSRFHYDWHWQSPYGNGDLGNQGIHQMDIARWGLGVDQLSDRVSSYGGRLGKGWTEDAGDTANSQVIVHEFGDKTIVFEVRNLASTRLMDASIGVIFHGSEGYVVLTSYTNGVAMDKDGNVVKKFHGGQYADHFANFIDAIRSRKHEDLAADILDGHLSSALCHTGNIAWELGQELPVAEVKTWADAYQGNDDAVDTCKRFAEHLEANSLDPAQTTVRLGAGLVFDPVTETFPGNDRANAMLTREYREPFVVPSAGEV